jgi:DNA-binding response OmpR family regulator
VVARRHHPSGGLDSGMSPVDTVRVARVLVIDDEDIIGTILSIALPHHVVVAAEDGREGLMLAEASAPDVIVLDLMMPVLDGYEVLKRLRDELHVSAPIVILTAVWSRDDHRVCIDAGATQVITKPFEPGAVAAAIDELVVHATT